MNDGNEGGGDMASGLSDARPRTMVELLERSLREHADRRLFGTRGAGGWEWVGYRRFGELVDAFRSSLAELGVGRGDTVAVISDNRLEWAVGAYATFGLGARYCPMYEAQQEDTWRFIIADSGARVVLAADPEIASTVEGFDLEGVEHVVTLVGGPERGPSYRQLVEQGERAEVPPADVDPDEVCSLIYTSGTTGDPKGVLLTHANITANVASVHALDIVRPDDVSVAFLPWAHVFGQSMELHLLLSVGAAMAVEDDPDRLLDDLAEVRPTVLFAVPRLFKKIYDGIERAVGRKGVVRRLLFRFAVANATHCCHSREQGGRSLVGEGLRWVFDRLVFHAIRARFGGRLRYAVSGGAKLDHELAHFIDALGIPVLEGYGLTETSPLVAVNLPGARRIGSVGRPVPGVEVEIREVEECAEGCGEVCVRGPNVMRGYHGRPDATAEVLEEDGTLRTGDLGELDEDGYLWIRGRLKEQFKLRNGKFVVPAPLEEALKLSVYVDEAMVVGDNQDHTAALVKVASDALEEWAEDHGVEPEDGLLDDPRVQELYRRELEERSKGFKHYEVPQAFRLVDDEWSPANGLMTPTLKLRRAVLERRYADLIVEMY